MHALFPVVALFDCPRDTANSLLVEWGHLDGPLTRPPEYGEWCHVLMQDDRPLAVLTASALVRDHVFDRLDLTRANTVELSRLCAARRDLNRVALRLWRECVFPTLGYAHAVSYQHATRHTGDVYRFDGWRLVTPKVSRSGTDKRGGRRGYPKRIWGWRCPPYADHPAAPATELTTVGA